MNRELKERIKNIIISILVVTGIFQVGILFGYQSQGSPTNLFLGLFGVLTAPRQVNDEVAREKLFIPGRLILSDGAKSYWILESKNEIYSNIWGEVKEDLHSIISGTVSMKKTTEDWGNITEKEGIIIDFGYSAKPELLAWFLGIDEPAGDLPEVSKVMISPDIVDKNTALVYIYTPDKKTYVSESIQFGEKVDLEKTYKIVADREKYRVYDTFRSANIDIALKSPPDVFYVKNSPPREWTYTDYNCRIPAKALNRDELASVILGNEKGRYDISKNINDSFQFSDNNNLYRFYSDGCLTYQYLSASNISDKGNIGSVILNTYKFIDKTIQLSDASMDIIMTDITEIQKGVYSISFDYRLGDMTVKLASGLRAGNTEDLGHAITIQADAKRVRKCVWLLREFVNAGKAKYNDRFTELMSLTGRGFDEYEIDNVESGYYLVTTRDALLKPNLLIDLKDGSTLPLEMPAEK